MSGIAESNRVRRPLRAIAIHGIRDGRPVVAYIKEPRARLLLAAGIGMWKKITGLKEIKCLPCRNCAEGFMVEAGWPKKWKCWQCSKTITIGKMAI